MRKTVLIIIALFITISLFFYEPLRQRIFHHTRQTGVQAGLISPLYTEFLKSFTGLRQGMTIYRTKLYENTANTRFSEIYHDSLATYTAEFVTVADKELIFSYTEALPRGKKEICLNVIPLSDSVSFSCQIGTEVQTRGFKGCRNQIKALSFNFVTKEAYPLKITVTGQAKLTIPQLFMQEKNISRTSNPPLLIIDLPADQVEILQKNLSANEWNSGQLPPLSYQPALALGALLNGQNSSAWQNLPEQYRKLAVNFAQSATSDYLTARQSCGRTIFAGMTSAISAIVQRQPLFDDALFFNPQTTKLDKLLELASGMLSEKNITIYLSLPSNALQSSEETTKLLLPQINSWQKKVAELQIIILSSEVNKSRKMPYLQRRSEKTTKMPINTPLDLIKALTIKPNEGNPTVATAIKMREDSLLYVFEHDTTTVVFAKNLKLTAQKRDADGQIIEQNLPVTNSLRQEFYAKSGYYLKIITLQNFSDQDKSYQINLTSDKNFTVAEAKHSRKTMTNSWNLTIPPRQSRVFSLLYENDGQIFSYTTKEAIAGVYGSISLPLGNINGFSEKSVVTPFSNDPILRRKAELRIENFALLPLWRYNLP